MFVATERSKPHQFRAQTMAQDSTVEERNAQSERKEPVFINLFKDLLGVYSILNVSLVTSVMVGGKPAVPVGKPTTIRRLLQSLSVEGLGRVPKAWSKRCTSTPTD